MKKINSLAIIFFLLTSNMSYATLSTETIDKIVEDVKEGRYNEELNK